MCYSFYKIWIYVSSVSILFMWIIIQFEIRMNSEKRNK